MRIRFTDLRFAVTGAARRTKRLWMSRHSRALSGSQSTYRRVVCCPWCAGSSHDGDLKTSDDAFGHANIHLLSPMKRLQGMKIASHS